MWRDGRRHPCRAAEALPHGLADHGDSTVAVLVQPAASKPLPATAPPRSQTPRPPPSEKALYVMRRSDGCMLTASSLCTGLWLTPSFTSQLLPQRVRNLTGY